MSKNKCVWLTNHNVCVHSECPFGGEYCPVEGSVNNCLYREEHERAERIMIKSETLAMVISCIDAVEDMTVNLENDHIAQSVFDYCEAIKRALSEHDAHPAEKTMREIFKEEIENHRNKALALEAALRILENVEVTKS